MIRPLLRTRRAMAPALPERPTVVLVHTPLVGPFSWSTVAAALRRRGYDVLVPDLRPGTDQGRQSGRWMPSFLMRASSVVRFSPRIRAAP